MILSSCIKEIDYHTSSIESQVVLNSLIAPNKNFIVHLSRTTSINQVLAKNNNAFLISIYENDSALKSLFTDKAETPMEIDLKEGSKYRIDVEIEGKNITAEDSIPKSVEFTVTGFVRDYGINEDGNSYGRFFVNFTDPENEVNYYEIISTIEQKNWATLSTIKSNDIVIENEGNKDYYPYGLLFKDEIFNGKQINLECYFESEEYEKVYIIKFRSVSQNYYLYKKKLMRHLYNKEGSVWTGTGEPVNLYTNVNGGLGIFAAYSERTDTIKIE